MRGIGVVVVDPKFSNGYIPVMKIRIPLQKRFQSFVESLVFTYDATGDLQNCASGDFPFTSNTSKNFLEITAMEKNTSLQ